MPTARTVTPLSPMPSEVAGQVEWALDRLLEPPEGEFLLGVVLSIRCLVNAIDFPDRQSVSFDTLRSVDAAFGNRYEEICAAAPSLEPSHILTCLRATCRALWLFTVSNHDRLENVVFHQVQDDLDHAALLADELDAVIRRDSIAAREAAGHRASSLMADSDPAASVH